MKSIIAKCPKCGKENEVTVKSVKKLIECSHCHKKMCLDVKSQRKIKYVRYFVMLIIAIGFAYSMEQFTKGTTGYLILIAYIAFVFMISRYIDDWCLKLGFLLFNLNYMDLDLYAEIRKPTLFEKREKKK